MRRMGPCTVTHSGVANLRLSSSSCEPHARSAIGLPCAHVGEERNKSSSSSGLEGGSAAFGPCTAMAPGRALPLLAVCGALWGLITAELPVAARFGGDITLSCLFRFHPGMNFQHLTLTWQKEQEGAEALVVHSYHYGRNQLETQDAAYRNRTWLDAEGLARGNGSLVLRDVRRQDEGVYLRHVTSALGETLTMRQLTVVQTSCIPTGVAGVENAGNAAGLGSSWVPLLGLGPVLILPLLS
ncbi:uncharacterized protein LOC142003896 isoform X2 [Carettochelys insculpta]|uniref:uncharacterized protein LOC142003896 isoform X2 n=1 Tax=Carettochelys insculpta TaxID=44489 RepID=UPI003EB7C027